MLPSYSTFASVTVARWILDLSMVRIMEVAPVFWSALALRLAARNLRLLRVQYAVVDQTDGAPFPTVRGAHEHGQREQRRIRKRSARRRERVGIAQLGVVDLGARRGRELCTHEREHALGAALAARDRRLRGVERAHE